MPLEFTAFLAKPSELIGVLLVGVIVGRFVERWFSQLRRSRWRESSNRWRRAQQGNGGVPKLVQDAPKLVLVAPKPRDAADQLRIVLAANFTVQPLLNRSEARVFRELDSMVLGCNPAWQVMAQVSLGEILRSKDADAYSCINSKRVDLLLIDENCQPRHAIEYQGAAHYQNAAAARDAVKKEALRRAGIGYHEVVGGHTTPAELKRLVERLVDKPSGAQERPV